MNKLDEFYLFEVTKLACADKIEEGNEMETIKTYKGDVGGQNYFIKDLDSGRLLEVSYEGNVLSVINEQMIEDSKGNKYTLGYAKLQQDYELLKAKNIKLKRKTKKLYKKMMHYKDLLGGFDD